MSGSCPAVVAIDTAGPVVGVAVLADGGRCGERTARVKRGAERLLVPWVIELCEDLGLAMSDLQAVGVARGPGAFTGLRVGLATASGLAMSLGIPMWPEMSLRHRALRVVRDDNVAVLCMLDARKQRVYAAKFVNAEDVVHGPCDVAPEVAIGWMNGPFRATGEGAIAYRELVERAGGVVDDDAANPCVTTLARLTTLAIVSGDVVDPAHVHPLYLREPDAKKPGDRRA